MKSRRARRTKADINNDLLFAAKELIGEVGFGNVTIMGIVERANIQASVFYNRYNDLDDLFDKIVREYDYFLNDSIKFNPGMDPVQDYSGLLNALVDSLVDDKMMQQLLVWELSSNNYITRRTSASRELNAKYLVEHFAKEFNHSGINSNVLTALITSGIYYLVTHRKLSTVCGIDFSKKEGIDLLKKTIALLAESAFNKSKIDSFNDQKDENADGVIQIAKSLIKNKVELKVIKEATNLSDEVLQSLINDTGSNNKSTAKKSEIITAPKKRGRKRKTPLKEE